VVGFRLIITTSSSSKSSSSLSSLSSSSTLILCSTSWSSVSSCEEFRLLLIRLDRVTNEFWCSPRFLCWWGGERLDDLVVVVGFRLIVTTSLSSPPSSSLSSISLLSSFVSSCDKLRLLLIHLDCVANEFCRSLRFLCWWEGERLDDLAVVVEFRLIITTSSSISSSSLRSILSYSASFLKNELHLLLIQLDRVVNEFCRFLRFIFWWGG